MGEVHGTLKTLGRWDVSNRTGAPIPRFTHCVANLRTCPILPTLVILHLQSRLSIDTPLTVQLGFAECTVSVAG